MPNQEVMDNFIAALKQLHARKAPANSAGDWKSEPLTGRPALKESEVGLLGLPLPDPGPDWLDVTLALLGSLPKIVPDAGGGNPQAQAKAVAAQGRGGDTEIAHVTPGNAGQCAFLRLTGPSGDGTLSTAAALTLPNTQNFLLVWNAAGAAVTVMCAAGTGVTIPAGAGAALYCDGSDYKNAAPTVFAAGLTVAGQIHGVSTGTAATDAVNLAQMSAAIATAAIPATNGTALNSVNDTSANYLSQKLTASGLITRSTVASGANESSNFAATGYQAIGINAYSISPSPAPAARAAFQTSYLVQFGGANTAAATLNDGLGAAALTRNGAALAPGDIPANAVRLVVWDGAEFQIAVSPPAMNPAAIAAAAVQAGAVF